jgi:glycosyltransferase involved in cell wall biosynthesis
MISIVIPAHNEGAVIARALTAMINGADKDELDVVVVCNGCSDSTASIARNFGSPVRVIETEIASKSNALNLGDQAVCNFPRIYADADVVIPLQTIRALAARLKQGDVLAVAPTALPDLFGCSWFVRAYYKIRSHLPSSVEGIGGSGVYALSESGRRRFGEFPNLVADDGYVRIQFAPKERETLTFVGSTVFAPRKIGNLIEIRTRAYYGNLELERAFPQLWRNRGESNHKALVGLLRRPSLWPRLLIYYYVNLTARSRARRRNRERSFLWERDNTSRQVVTEVVNMSERASQ